MINTDLVLGKKYFKVGRYRTKKPSKREKQFHSPSILRMQEKNIEKWTRAQEIEKSALFEIRWPAYHLSTSIVGYQKKKVLVPYCLPFNLLYFIRCFFFSQTKYRYIFYKKISRNFPYLLMTGIVLINIPLQKRWQKKQCYQNICNFLAFFLFWIIYEKEEKGNTLALI